MFKVDFTHTVHGYDFIICNSIESDENRLEPMVCLLLENKSSLNVLTTTIKKISIHEK